MRQHRGLCAHELHLLVLLQFLLKLQHFLLSGFFAKQTFLQIKP